MAFSSTPSSQTPTTTRRTLYNRCGNEICYFPNCRRDANCSCEICMESFNATKDLHSALTFPTKKTKRRILTSSPPSNLDPDSSISSLDHSQPSISTVNSQPKKEMKKSKKNGFSIMRYFAGCLLFVGILLSLMVSFGCLERFGPKLKYEIVRGFIEDISSLDGDVRLKLETLEKKLNGLIGINGGVLRKCSFMDSAWKLNQDEGNRLLYQWKCVVYKSVAEELSVWGSPLQTSGFIMAGYSSRSLTLLSGNITEWSQGNLVPVSRTRNKSTWKLLKFTSAAVQLEKETWVLEYSRNTLWDNPGLIQNIWIIFKELGKQMSAVWLKLMHTFISVFEGYYYSNSKCKQIVTPT